jgi:palmitoyltransferase
MSFYGDNGARSLSVLGHFNRMAFSLVAVLAVAAHFKAMTTDPGAVPPDAHPLPDPSDIENASETAEIKPQIIVNPTQKGRRLCRRCNAFKPQRAHHCRYVT